MTFCFKHRKLSSQQNTGDTAPFHFQNSNLGGKFLYSKPAPLESIPTTLLDHQDTLLL